MAKYSQKMLETCRQWIAEHGLIEYGGAMMKDYCAMLGIHDKSHRNWLRDYPEYAQMIEEAKEQFKRSHTKMLFNTLMEAAIGGEHEVEEEHTDYRPDPANGNRPMIVAMKRHKKKIFQAPNVAAGIFLLCNLDPEHFRQRQSNDVTLKKGEPEAELSIDEVKAEIQRLLE